ncbi:MAG: lysophospholipid acyltransferase family protein [Candidatus Omnitrophica bacterium]|nr:lysophospholipid acyltransferase family protein [Candidatus Omnitrophota bacterium]
MIMYLLYRLGQWLALSLPHALAYRVGVILTSFKYIFCSGERKAMRKNLEVILGENHPGIKKYPAQIYANFGRYLVDFFRARKIDKKFIDKFVKIENLEYMDNALKKGKGVIGLTAHLGNWELCAQILTRLGYKMNAIALTHKNSRIDDLFSRQRQLTGIKVIPVGMSVRKCFSALRKNEIVGILGDRDFSGENGIFVDFLNRSFMAPLGPAVLSLRTGAAIVPAFVIRDEKDERYFRYIFSEPIYPEYSDDEKKDIKQLTIKYIKVIEKFVKLYPQQWFVFHEFQKAEKIEIL